MPGRGTAGPELRSTQSLPHQGTRLRSCPAGPARAAPTREHVDRPVVMRRSQRSGAPIKTMPLAGEGRHREGRRSRLRGRSGVPGELTSRPPSAQGTTKQIRSLASRPFVQRHAL
jgi:hypothetical protein